MQGILFTSFTLTSSIGTGCKATLTALRAQNTGISRKHWESINLESCIGEVEGLEEFNIRDDLADFDCRNNRLAQFGLEQDDFTQAVQSAIERFGRGRVGVFMGTSTSGIHSSEIAYRNRDANMGTLPEGYDYRHTHNSYSVADFICRYFGLTGPSYVVSTACSSSAKVFGSAQRMIKCGLIDAAIVGGVDSLCLTTMYGFDALQLVSSNPCKPFDAFRDGISIGEAAAFVLVESTANAVSGDILMTGIGESSDAHHMSSPHPEGLGARIAMQAALQMAGLQSLDIDYINLHGTATHGNDAAEAKGVTSIFGSHTPCSSTKGHTGHTLGAAGAVEAIICSLALQNNFAPGGAGTNIIDPDISCRYLLSNIDQPMHHVLSNSFGFGGSNCSLVFSKVIA